MEDIRKKYQRQVEQKMFKFCDTLVKEFHHTNENLVSRIYLELGYHETAPKPRKTPADLFDDLISQYPMSTMSWIEKEARPRRKSIHVFKRRRGERRLRVIDWDQRQRLMSAGAERPPIEAV